MRPKLGFALNCPIFAAAAALALGWGCGNKGAKGRETLCDPGENIYCRCDNGDSGVKKCATDGNSFSECGHCHPAFPAQQSVQVAVASSSSGAGGMHSVASSTASMSSSGGSGAGGASMTKALLAPCNFPEECDSNKCSYGYCTKKCAKFSDCPFPAAECVSFEGAAVCMPTCKTAANCEPVFLAPSLCGYAKAIDDLGVRVCADWGSQHQLMPAGTSCVSPNDSQCNLGYLHKQSVCANNDKCAVGCYDPIDCPNGKMCSLVGDPGTCK